MFSGEEQTKSPGGDGEAFEEVEVARGAADGLQGGVRLHESLNELRPLRQWFQEDGVPEELSRSALIFQA